MLPGNETVVFHTVTGTSRDTDGNKIPVYTDTVVSGCLFDPGGSTELLQGQDTVTTQPTVYAPGGSAVPLAVDQATVRGVRYDVDGTPADWQGPSWHPGIVIRLKAVNG